MSGGGEAFLGDGEGLLGVIGIRCCGEVCRAMSSGHGSDVIGSRYHGGCSGSNSIIIAPLFIRHHFIQKPKGLHGSIGSLSACGPA